MRYVILCFIFIYFKAASLKHIDLLSWFINFSIQIITFFSEQLCNWNRFLFLLPITATYVYLFLYSYNDWFYNRFTYIYPLLKFLYPAILLLLKLFIKINLFCNNNIKKKKFNSLDILPLIVVLSQTKKWFP